MDKLDALWNGANYQDNLLQTYRGFHLTIQSILIAVGTGLTIAIISFENPKNSILSYLLLLILSILAVYLLFKMKKLIIARGKDVDYFHKKIIEHENNLPSDEQVMIEFKRFQKDVRTITNEDNYFKSKSSQLNTDEINLLVDKGMGHTRKFLDKHLFIWFNIIWLSFHIISYISFIILYNNS